MEARLDEDVPFHVPLRSLGWGFRQLSPNKRPRYRHSARQRIDAPVLALIKLLTRRARRRRRRCRNAAILPGIELLFVGTAGLVALVATLLAALIARPTLIALVATLLAPL